MIQSEPRLNLSITAVVYALCMQTALGGAVHKILATLSLAQRIAHPLSSGTTSPPGMTSASKAKVKKWRPRVSMGKCGSE